MTASSLVAAPLAAASLAAAALAAACLAGAQARPRWPGRAAPRLAHRMSTSSLGAAQLPSSHTNTPLALALPPLPAAVLRVPVQQLAALPAADLAPANDAPGHAAGSGPSLGQPALLQRLRQVQRQLQASQPSPAAQADLKPSTGEAPPTEAPASVQTAADGYTGTHPLHSHSGQAGGSDSSGSGSQPGGHGPAGSGQPGVGGSAGASEGGQPSAAGQGGQSGDAHDPCSSGSPLVGSGNAGEELQQQQQQPGEPQQPKAEPELQLQGGQEEAEEDEEADPQQRQQPGAAGPAQDQNGGPARHSQPLDPLCSAFIGAAPLAPPPPAVPFEASGASREVELLAAAAKAFSAAPGPRADSGCASHSRAAGSAVQAAAEAAAAGNLLSGLDSLGPLSLSSLQGQPSSLAALDLASVPGRAGGHAAAMVVSGFRQSWGFVVHGSSRCSKPDSPMRCSLLPAAALLGPSEAASGGCTGRLLTCKRPPACPIALQASWTAYDRCSATQAWAMRSHTSTRQQQPRHGPSKQAVALYFGVLPPKPSQIF